MNHTTKMKAWWIVLAIAIALVAIFLSSGCVTIKYLPPSCKKDTVYIIKNESPLKFQSMPYYPFDHGINPLIPFLDTSFMIKSPYISYDTGLIIRDWLPADTLKSKWGWQSHSIKLSSGLALAPVVDTFYRRLAKQAEQITNAKQ